MKIGFVFDDTLDKPDGVQQYMLTLTPWLEAQGHEVHFLVGATVRKDLAHMYSLSRNIRVRFNNNRLSIPLPANKRRIREILAREQFDILHVQMPYSPMLAGRIIAAAPPATAVVGTFHILPFSRLHHHANRTLGIALRRNLRRFDAVMAVSHAAQQFAKGAYRITSTVVPNTVETNRFAGVKPYTDTSTTPKQHIVFLGRLVERKGCRYLLQAVHKLVATKQLTADALVVDICGKGELEPQLRQYVQTHGLGDIVRFHGFVTEEQKARYLAGADIAVFPATGGESFGIVLIEAMAAGGKVVLGGNNPGYASVLRAEQLFDPTDTAALAMMITQYLTDKQSIQSAFVWQKQAVKQYDVAIVGSRVVEVYTQALHRRQS